MEISTIQWIVITLEGICVLQVPFLIFCTMCNRFETITSFVSLSATILLSMYAYSQEEDTGTSWFLLKRKAQQPCKKHDKKTWDMNWQSVKCNSDKDEGFWHKWQPISHLYLMSQASNQRKVILSWKICRS